MSELKETRKQKLEQLADKGIDPFGFVPGGIKGLVPIETIRSLFDGQDTEPEETEVRVAGRIMGMRGHGKTVFFDLQDDSGSIQGYIRKDNVGDEKMEIFGLLDIGDLISVTGSPFVTRTGEPTVLVKDFALMAKSLLPLPEKWHGLRDVEIRFRKRYLDLIANRESKEIFRKRSLIIGRIRGFLEQRGFMEVETPMMQAIPGGATATPFKTHHNTLDMTLYLRIAPELFLKRLLVGGFEKVFEINRNFRNEGISTQHNPEFTMIEIYQAYADYSVMMDLTEELIGTVLQEVCESETVSFQDMTIHLARPWKRVTFESLIQTHCGIKDIDDETLCRSYAEKENLDIAGKAGAGILDEIFSEKVEPHLIDPVFVTEYPSALCPLSKTKPDNPLRAERFELMMGRMEIANAYSELNDPIEQEERFKQQAGTGAEGFDGVIDYDFIEALEYGMPPAGGLGIGIDRLVMVLLGVSSIRDVILFPLLKAKE